MCRIKNITRTIIQVIESICIKEYVISFIGIGSLDPNMVGSGLSSIVDTTVYVIHVMERQGRSDEIRTKRPCSNRII